MTKLEQAARQALGALEVATTPLAKDRQEVLRAITTLREALSGVQALSAAPEAFLKSVIALCSHRGHSPANIEAWDKDDKWIADLWRQAESMLAASPTPPAEQQAAPKAAPGDALDEAMRERDDAEDFIDATLDEVLGHERPEWSSSYGRADALNDVQERMTALHKPAVDKAWGQFQSAKAAPQQEAQEPTEIPEEIERMAADRYKVVPSHESMFHRWAVVAGTGTQQLYLGREVECQNMARKFAGAFLDGAFVAMQRTAPQPAPHLPERDASLPAERQGLFRKFVVGRVDGSDKPGGKHYGCTYFVLDVDHDPCARPALAAYAAACESTHPTLAADLRTKWGVVPAPQPAPAPLSDDVVQDAAFEAVRRKLCALPRFSFLSDGYGVRRVPDKSGSWIAFDAAHALFDPVAVDAAIAAQGGKV